jgi:glycosyltransferase involved in cell wall biosynthesis
MTTPNMTNSKICFLIPSVASGGIEMYLLRYLNFIDDTKNITVLVRSNQKGELYEEYKATGVELKFLPLGYLSLSKIRQHYKYYKKQKFDVICDFNANFAGIPLLLAKRLNVTKRIAFYRQGSDHFKSGFIKNRVNKYMNRLVFKNATHILSNSHAGLKFFFPERSSTDARFKVIYNGVNIAEYNIKESKASIRAELGIPKNAFVIGHVGRLDKAKNHETILKVFHHLQQEEFKSFLVLCGRDTEKLVPQLEALGIQEKTLLSGYREDVPRVLKSLDCFLFPSITEGQPNALIEAMVSAIPIVASNISAIKECVPSTFVKNLKNPFDIEGLKSEVIKVSKTSDKSGLDEIRNKFDNKTNFEIFNRLIYE